MEFKAKVIVNADDFGENENINCAILKSFELGLISTTTLLCNRPGFDEACALVHQNNLSDRIGIHLNITQGGPLTEPIKKIRNFYLNDQMFHSFKGHLLNNEERNAVYIEFQAQIDRCKQNGINPTHIDSHHGMHNYWGIGKIIIELAIKNKIPAIRLRVNWGNISRRGRAGSKKIYNLRGKVYSMLHNYRIRISGLAKTKYFCEIMNVTPELLAKDTLIEVNTHPWMKHDIIMDSCTGENLIEMKKKFLPITHFETFRSIG